MLEYVWKGLLGVGATAGLLVLVRWCIEVAVKYAVDRKLESVRADLRKDILEHEVIYRKLYDRISDGVADIFIAIAELQSALEAYMYVRQEATDVAPAAEALKIAREKFLKSYTANRLLLPHSLYELIRDYDSTSFHASIECVHAVGRIAVGQDDIWPQVIETITKDLPSKISAIHSAFQTLLGLPKVLKH